MAERSHPTSEVRGKKLGGPHAQRAAAKKSYPVSEVGGRPRGDTQHPGSGVATRAVTLCLRPGVVAGRTNPTSKEPWLHGRRRA